MNMSALDILFKVLAAGLLPAAIWINSLSVDVALLREQGRSSRSRLDKVEAQQQNILEGVRENQVALQGMVVTMNFMKDLLPEIKNAK